MTELYIPALPYLPKRARSAILLQGPRSSYQDLPVASGVVLVVTHIKTLPLLVLFACGSSAAQDARMPSGDVQVPLVVSSGVPLRVYITKRLRMREGEPVRAKLIEPIYAFDRIVVPSGVDLQGHVTLLDPVSKMKRAQAILGGDFTPLHFARVEFTAIVMPDGHTLPIHTADSKGLQAIYMPPRPEKKKKSTKPAQSSKPAKTSDPSQSSPGVSEIARQQIHQEVQKQIQARTRGVIDLVRSTNKKEWVEDFLIKKMPYHPQWYRSNTRFDAVLRDPLSFGNAAIPIEALKTVGLPSAESIGQVRLLTPLSSADADTNTKVEGVLSHPLFSADHKLMLPEGTLLTGRVRRAQPARWFHRGGQLRFTFDRVQPPASTTVSAIALERKQLQVAGVEANQTHAKVDSEGNVKATEPKSRLLGPAVALMVASRAMDNDEGRDRVGTGGGSANYGGRTTGGFSGFGLLGSAAAQASKTVGSVLGLYGLGWSVYSTIVSRGADLELEKNAAVEVRFGSRAPDTSKVVNHLARVVTR
jgi:hypothetical protein